MYVAELGDLSEPFSHASATQDGSVTTEPWDGRWSEPVDVTYFALEMLHGERWETHMESSDIKTSFYVTDSRVVIWAPKFSKGSTWFGSGLIGLPVAIGATIVSKTRAAAKGRGKALLGHIRYEWLYAVGYVRKTGWNSSESIRLIYKDSKQNQWHLDLTLPKYINAAHLARDIAQRAAKYRLAMVDPKEADEVQEFEQLATNPPDLETEPGKYSLYQMPSNYPAPGGWKHRPPEPGRAGQPAQPVGKNEPEPKDTEAKPDQSDSHAIDQPTPPDGAISPETNQPPQRRPKFCTGCGSPLAVDHLFCITCGRQMVMDSATNGG